MTAKPKCQHCHERPVHKRGVCWLCYRQPEVRDQRPNGNPRRPKPTSEMIDTVRRRNAEGWPDGEIAAEIGVPIHYVCHWRRSVGIPPVAGKNAPVVSERYRASLTAGVRRAKAEGKRFGGVCCKDHIAFARSHGMPDDMPPTAISILLALLDGPLTLDEIAARVGLKSKSSLTNCGGGKSYTSSLMDRRLIAYLRRHAPDGRPMAGLFMLTAAALELLSANHTAHEGQ